MKKTIIALSCCFLLAGVFNSCKKPSSSPDSSNFTGTWIGTGTLTENGVAQGTQPDTLVFVAGSDGNHVILQDAGTCKGGTVVTFTLNGNALSLPSTVVTDGCGNKSTDSGAGSLSGGTLTLNIQESLTVNIPGASSTGGDTLEAINASVVLALTKK